MLIWVLELRLRNLNSQIRLIRPFLSWFEPRFSFFLLWKLSANLGIHEKASFFLKNNMYLNWNRLRFNELDNIALKVGEISSFLLPINDFHLFTMVNTSKLRLISQQNKYFYFYSSLNDVVFMESVLKKLRLPIEFS